ncbi:MAG: hypothetical protein IT454_05945 [Planctomycetes bacterium]|nr:hypothetical protein [Planctomycetota bacterium]
MSEHERDLASRERPEASEALLAPARAAGASTGVTRTRKVVAMAIAALSDAVSLGAQLAPPLQIAVDVATAVALFAVLGFRWPLLPVLVVEAIPGLATFPTWMLVVGVLVGVTPTKSSGA